MNSHAFFFRFRRLFLAALLASTIAIQAQDTPPRRPGGFAGRGRPGGFQGRGGAGDSSSSIPGLSESQQAALRALNESLVAPTRALTAARNSLANASFVPNIDEAELKRKVEAVAIAELTLANARALAIARIQASENKLNEEQLAAFAKGRPISPPKATAKIEVPPKGGLGNFGVVDNRLLRGSLPTPNAILELKTMGVSTIIDLIPSENPLPPEKAEATRDGITYKSMPMKSAARPTFEQVNAILSAITNAPGKVFIHCQAGKDRTGAIVACYRITQYGWSSDQALKEATDFNMDPKQVALKEFVIDFGKNHPPAAK